MTQRQSCSILFTDRPAADNTSPHSHTLTHHTRTDIQRHEKREPNLIHMWNQQQQEKEQEEEEKEYTGSFLSGTI